MKKILLLVTGGTLVSADQGEGLTPYYNVEDLLNYVLEIKGMCSVIGKSIMNIDSSNMTPMLWRVIAQNIYDCYNTFDGFVIIHGTDTMAFTASALTYILQNLGKPVVLTGSQFSIERTGSDAKGNILDAVKFALEDVSGVFIAFHGKIIKGTRAMKVKTKSLDAFRSINTPYVAHMKDGKIMYCDGRQSRRGDPSEKLVLDWELCENIILLKLFPGLDIKIFDYIKSTYRGVIIESFGVGGIPFEHPDMTEKIKALIDAGIAVVVTTQCLEEGVDFNIYKVGKKLAKHKIIYGKDMTTEALVPKLMWALGKTKDLDRVKNLIETVNSKTSRRGNLPLQ